MIIAGAVVSAVRYARDRRSPGSARLAAANVLIALGTLVLSSGGLVQGIVGHDEAFALEPRRRDQHRLRRLPRRRGFTRPHPPPGRRRTHPGRAEPADLTYSCDATPATSGAAALCGGACRRACAGARRGSRFATGTCSGPASVAQCAASDVDRDRRTRFERRRTRRRLHRCARSGSPMTAASATPRVGHEHLLDLGRVHVEARHDDEVLGPVDELELAAARRRRRCRRSAATRPRSGRGRSRRPRASTRGTRSGRGPRSRPDRRR